MNMKTMKLFHPVVMSLLVFAALRIEAQPVAYDLGKLFRDNKLTIVNRHASNENGNVLKLDTALREGLVWLSNVTFSAGTIDVDLKGKDVLQRSFLGVAFHGLNDSTYDAVYFRPFNFLSTDPVRKIHAVQYISHPTYTWKRLREERNGVFEKGLISPPDPDTWFHARIVVSKKSVQVFVNNDNVPSLAIESLNERTTGKLGLWVGNESDGEFKNLVLTPAK